MRVFDTKDFIGGWVIGDFEPTLMKTRYFEFAYKEIEAGYKTNHVHDRAAEMSIVTRGVCKANGELFTTGKGFLLNAGDPIMFEAISDCCVAVVKFPSVKNDKRDLEGVRC